ncbi:hypothetical protein MKW98_007386 [Papaver atlanticum]|uniref:Uncharacterized protein n=1 Tax=Papaver atlanticum TaxID=357466 RepID=A0AAD4SCG7_9MAGN|nr:hypothetical protein MKW98_007386 [Papaver atlanticum]
MVVLIILEAVEERKKWVSAGLIKSPPPSQSINFFKVFSSSNREEDGYDIRSNYQECPRNQHREDLKITEFLSCG